MSDSYLKIGDGGPIKVDVTEIETNMIGRASFRGDFDMDSYKEIQKTFAHLGGVAYAPIDISTGIDYGIGDTEPEVDEERRKQSDEVQYQDLKVGDILYHSDNNAHREITKITPKRAYWKTEDGVTGFWSRTDDALEGDNITIISDAEREANKVSYDDVILSESSKLAINDALTQIDNHDLIFNTWGFGNILEKGKAISMLFYGPPGTGKTLMAQAIADKYNYNLKVISSAEIESSEPGQAERNIKAFFEAANKDRRTVLLFDECDSLIADRRDVGMILGAQINTLLSSLEAYEGIAIFTTNRLEKMDEAFNRRLSLKLEFAMPDAEQRVKIWKRMFPPQAPLSDDIDWNNLASIPIAGGYIKNIVLRAARRAANTEEKIIDYRIIFNALREECASMEQFDKAVNSTPRIRVR